jgi:mRNA interferase RelE/StbE
MAWKIEFERAAERELSKLDRQTSQRILKFLHERVAPLSDPRSLGQALQGPLHAFWKYRVGDYRIITSIEDKQLRVLVVRIGNRREVYR